MTHARYQILTPSPGVIYRVQEKLGTPLGVEVICPPGKTVRAPQLVPNSIATIWEGA